MSSSLQFTVNVLGTSFTAPVVPELVDNNSNLIVFSEVGAAGVVWEFPDEGANDLPFTTLASFNGASIDDVISDASGNLFVYADATGPASSNGEIFELAKSGSSYAPKTLVATIDYSTYGGGLEDLAVDEKGDLFGATAYSAAGGGGSVFEIPINTTYGHGGVTSLYDFGTTNAPSDLVFDGAGDVFGIIPGTMYTGPFGPPPTYGSVFEVSTAGSTGYTFTTLFTFDGLDGAFDGYAPGEGDARAGALALNAAGDLIGLTSDGGTPDGTAEGTVFELAPNDAGGYDFETIYTFESVGDPTSLVIDGKGNIFGVRSGYPQALFEVPFSNGVYSNSAVTFSLSSLLGTSSSEGTSPITPANLVPDNLGNLFSEINTEELSSTGASQFQYNLEELSGAGFQVACYSRGTRIATRRGDIPIEMLLIGDHVLTAGGAFRPIIWIGRRHIYFDRQFENGGLRPVLVRAGAFEFNQPERDLVLSPDHAVFVDNVLIPIKHLINGKSIEQTCVNEIEYWHVELDTHDILLAEGLTAESYLDTGNRAAFSEASVGRQTSLCSGGLSWDEACAALVQDGPRLVATKQRLFERAGIVSTQPLLTFRVRSNQSYIQPEILELGYFRYTIPHGSHVVTLISPSWVPANCQPTSVDRRSLGVRLLGVQLDDTAVELETDTLEGFYPLEVTAEGPCRWTNGIAHISLPASAKTLTLHIGDGASPMSLA